MSPASASASLPQRYSFFSQASALLDSSETVHRWRQTETRNRLMGMKKQFESPAQTAPLQQVITSLKSVAISFRTSSESFALHSQALKGWSAQSQSPGTSEIASHFSTLHNHLSASLGPVHTTLLASRNHLKSARDAENALVREREALVELQRRWKGEASAPHKSSLKLEVEEKKREVETGEAVVEQVMKTALKEAGEMEMQALRELAHRLLLIADTGSALLESLSTAQTPYTSIHNESVTDVLENALKSLDLQRAPYGYVESPPLEEGGAGAATNSATNYAAAEAHLRQNAADAGPTEGHTATSAIETQPLPSASPAAQHPALPEPATPQAPRRSSSTSAAQSSPSPPGPSTGTPDFYRRADRRPSPPAPACCAAQSGRSGRGASRAPSRAAELGEAASSYGDRGRGGRGRGRGAA